MLRIDKYLWAVRLFKTRGEASRACRAGEIKINDRPVKPSGSVQVGDRIERKTGESSFRFRALVLTERRIGPKLIAEYIEPLV